MSSMPARKINPKNANIQSTNSQSTYSSGKKESLKKNEDKFTVWDWMMWMPIGLFILFSVLEKMSVKIFESSNNTLILSALAIIFGFGFLMSTVTAAQKGRVRVFRKRTRGWKMRETEWVEKSKNPKKFLFVVISRLGVAFAFCVGAVYAFLTSVF